MFASSNFYTGLIAIIKNVCIWTNYIIWTQVIWEKLSTL